MSAEDLALFLRQKMGEQRTNNTDIVRRSNISRRTWYRLLNADIEEAKLSTLIKLANALNTSVTQLLQIYFDGSPINKYGNDTKSQITTPHLHISSNLPCNCLININQKFTKTWTVQNQTGDNWEALTLKCIDDNLDVRTKQGEKEVGVEPLKTDHPSLLIPTTNIGDTADISINFIAPPKLGPTVSHWAFFRDDQQLEGDGYPILSCLIKVVAIT